MLFKNVMMLIKILKQVQNHNKIINWIYLIKLLVLVTLIKNKFIQVNHMPLESPLQIYKVGKKFVNRCQMEEKNFKNLN